MLTLEKLKLRAQGALIRAFAILFEELISD